MRKKLGIIFCLLAFLALPAFADNGEWLRDAGQAFKAAQASGKPLLVDLYADWCVWCKTLDREVFSTDAFRTYTQQFVRLRVNVEDESEGAMLQARYEAQELPTLLVLTPHNSLIGRVVGFAPVDAFIGKIEDVLQEDKNFEEHYRQVKAGHDVLALQHLAIELHDRADGARAQAIYERLLQQPNVPAAQQRWIHYLIADCLRLQGKFDAARTEMVAVRQQADGAHDDELLSRLEQLGLLIGRDRRGCDSVQALRTFLDEYPRSSLRGQASHLIQSRQQSLNHACA